MDESQRLDNYELKRKILYFQIVHSRNERIEGKQV
jgi:hypothetical protein